MIGEWEHLRTLLAVVRHGSVAAAAGALGLRPTSVARRLAAAEAALGVPLLERRDGALRPTAAGRDAAAAAERMEAEHAAFHRRLGGAGGAVAGPLVVTAPQLLIATHLGPVIEAFLAAHPAVELTVRASNALLNLHRREADLAIRVSDAPGDSLVGRVLVHQQAGVFAAPAIAARVGAGQLDGLGWIAFAGRDWPPKGVAPPLRDLPVRVRFDDMVAVVAAAEAGLGLARMPLFLGRSRPGLVAVPGALPQPYPPIWALTHPDLRDNARVRAFRAVLDAAFRARAGDFVAAEGGAFATVDVAIAGAGQ